MAAFEMHVFRMGDVFAHREIPCVAVLRPDALAEFAELVETLEPGGSAQLRTPDGGRVAEFQAA